jgi:hypothetical protein
MLESRPGVIALVVVEEDESWIALDPRRDPRSLVVGLVASILITVRRRSSR